MNYSLGCAFTLGEMLINFPYKKLQITCKDCKAITGDNHRDLLVKKVFKESVKLVIEDIIENNSDFNVEKDLTKGSKREDTLAYQISIDVALLNEVIKESYELDSIDEEELFDEYMTLSDELAMELEEYMPEDVIINARAYKWDNSDNTIKLVLAMAHLELGELKLSDITRRLLTQVD